MVPSRLSDDLYEFGNVGLLPGEDLRWANADGGREESMRGSADLALTPLRFLPSLLTYGPGMGAAASLSSRYQLSHGSVATPTASLHLQKKRKAECFHSVLKSLQIPPA